MLVSNLWGAAGVISQFALHEICRYVGDDKNSDWEKMLFVDPYINISSLDNVYVTDAIFFRIRDII